jgi:hypothetical protein
MQGVKGSDLITKIWIHVVTSEMWVMAIFYGEKNSADVGVLQKVDTGTMHLDCYPVMKETNTNCVWNLFTNFLTQIEV